MTKREADYLAHWREQSAQNIVQRHGDAERAREMRSQSLEEFALTPQGRLLLRLYATQSSRSGGAP